MSKIFENETPFANWHDAFEAVPFFVNPFSSFDLCGILCVNTLHILNLGANKAVHSCISAHAEYVYDLKEPDLGLLKHLLASVALRLEAKFLAWPISSQI